MKKWRNHILNSQSGIGLHYLEGMSSYVFMSCVESLWGSGGAEPHSGDTPSQKATNCPT